MRFMGLLVIVLLAFWYFQRGSTGADVSSSVPFNEVTPIARTLAQIGDLEYTVFSYGGLVAGFPDTECG